MNRTVLVLTSKIRNKKYADTLAYVNISVNYSSLESLLLRVSANNGDMDMFFTDSSGMNLSTYDTIYEGRSFNDSQTLQMVSYGDYIYIAKKLGSTPWFIVIRYHSFDLLQYYLSIVTDNGYVFLILITLSVITIYMLSRSLIHPLRTILTGLERMKPGEAEILMKSSFIDEISEINDAFNEMIIRIDSLVENLILSNNVKLRLENDKKNAEIVALQMQVNPHFLSNTINTISNIVIDGHTKQALSMLRSMNNLFRYAISKPEYIITVEEELQYVRAYLDIMRVRFRNINIFWNIDECLYHCLTIKLLLQPILENAISHGLKTSEYRGIIEIHCYEEYDCVCYMVCDNGKGMNENQLQQLREDLGGAKLGSLIGLFNVQARIRLHFGEKYGLEIHSEKNIGTKVIVRIPKIFPTNETNYDLKGKIKKEEM